MEITESKLIAYFDNQLTGDERQEVEAWIMEDERNQKFACDLEKILFVSSVEANDRYKSTIKALGNVKRRINNRKRRRIWHMVQRIAAVAILPLIGITVLLVQELKREHQTMIEISAVTGLINCVTLPDSTKVWLNSNSTLSYPTRFNSKERKVTLTGEAFFQVTKQEKQKFIVQMHDTEVEVLGTEFNVEAYSESDEIRTTLVTGKVNFWYNGRDTRRHVATLDPGQQVVYNVNNKELSLMRTKTNVLTSWKDGLIVLDDTPLVEALRQLSNKYNVEFVIANEELKENRYTGTFVNQNLDLILGKFKASSGINFREAQVNQGVKKRTVFEVY